MSAKPILFNTDMVRAIQNDAKTVTRRVVKPQPYSVIWSAGNKNWCWHFVSESGKVLVDKQPYRPGDILYARETWHKDVSRYMYKADYSDSEKFFRNGKEVPIKWRPSIHMPREAARIFLRVTDVRVERLQAIEPSQLRAEGMYLPGKLPHECERAYARMSAYCRCQQAEKEFADLWNSTIKPADRVLYGWDANPWVRVIEFERISREEAMKVENHPTQT